LVRDFALKKKMVLKVEKSSWIPDPPSSWVAKNWAKKRGAVLPFEKI
jgi:hypothetical protein